MTKPEVHEKIIELILSTNEIFKNFSANDLKSISGREAPPETNADKEVASYLTRELSKIVPGDSIIVEDGDPIIGLEGKSTWVIDPIYVPHSELHGFNIRVKRQYYSVCFCVQS